MAQLTPEQAQEKALEAVQGIDDIEGKNPKLKGGTYPELELLTIRAGIDGRYDSAYYAFEFRVLKNDGRSASSPVDSVAAHVINIGQGKFADIKKGVLKSLMNACGGREVKGAEYAKVIKEGTFDGNVISAVATEKQGANGPYVKLEVAPVRRKQTGLPIAQATAKVDAVIASASKGTANNGPQL